MSSSSNDGQAPKRKKPEELRSQQWFGRQDRDGFAYRSWVKGKGVPWMEDRLEWHYRSPDAPQLAAALADVVVVATPWDAAAVTVSEVATQLRGKVVISMANALAKVGHEFQPLVPPRGSVAASVQAAVPKSRRADRSTTSQASSSRSAIVSRM